MCSPGMTPYQVQEREQKNPDDVDEVPVEAADLDRVAVLPGNHAPPRPPQHHAHDAETDDHVQRVNAGHHEIQREEDLRLPEMFGLELKPETRHVVLGELGVVLERLDPQKHGPEE